MVEAKPLSLEQFGDQLFDVLSSGASRSVLQSNSTGAGAGYTV
jgi:hypothetical protein